jgi:hypothetical protein
MRTEQLVRGSGPWSGGSQARLKVMGQGLARRLRRPDRTDNDACERCDSAPATRADWR